MGQFELTCLVWTSRFAKQLPKDSGPMQSTGTGDYVFGSFRCAVMTAQLKNLGSAGSNFLQ